MRNLYDEGKNGFLKDKQKLKKQLRSCFILLTTLITTHCASAQLVVTQNANAQDLAQLLAGTGVTISNCTKTANTNSTGTFVNSGTNLGLSSGVILSTGNVANASQAANAFASSSYTGNGDAQLQTLTGGYVYDKTVLEFDVTPQGNVLMFNYVFASEEYPEWVCSQFNDVFGFFISGSNPAGGNYSNKNIARVPGTNLPVAINTINRGLSGVYGNPVNCQSLSYSSLHLNNLTPTVNPSIVYDGMTVVLTASASVIPCQTYHLKLAVADVSDRIYDSGVMLQANSVVSVPVTISSTADLDYAGYNSTYEGCVGGKFTFSIPTPQPSDVLVNISVSGTAINGVDYPAIPSSITIPAGTLSKDVIVMPVQDGIAEADEDIVITTTNPCTGQPLSSAMMMIKDDVAANISANQTVLCNGQSSQMIATGGLNYTWSPATGLSNAGVYNPVATPATTTTYTVTMNWGSCNKTATKTISVGGSGVSLTAQPALTTCDGSPVQLTVNGSGSFTWNNGTNASTLNIASSGTYSVTSTDVSGCTATASANVVVSDLSVSNPAIVPSCSGANSGSININVNGLGAPFTYNWSNAATSEDLTNVGPGNYVVTVSNTDGCSLTQSYTVNQTTSSITLLGVVTDVSCNGGNNGNIQLNVAGGNTPYDFVWNNGSTNQSISNLNAGTYDVIVTDAIGCMQSQSFVVSENNGIQVSASKADVTCNGGSNGSITLNVTGGNSVYNFVWNDGDNNQNRTNLPAGNYSVTVTDGNGCFAINNNTIGQPNAIALTLSTTGTDCSSPSGSANVSVVNGVAPFNYVWSHNTGIHTASVNNLTTGNISVSVTDANGCTATQSGVVGVAANTTNADFTYSGSYCAPAASIQFTHNGSANVNHYWNFGGNNNSYATNPSFTFTSAGNYNVVHIVNSNFCSDTVVKTISISTAPSVSGSINHVSCGQTNNGSIYLNILGGSSPFQYNWSDGVSSANRNNLPSGNYTVVITDQHSCSASFNAAVTQIPGLNINTTSTNPSCFGSANGNIHVNVAGGTAPFTYMWSNGANSPVLSNLSGSNYTISVFDANNCSATKSVSLTEPSEIVVNHTKSDVVCNGQNNGSISVNVSGGNGAYIYHWSNNAASQMVTALPAGYYTLTVTDANNCSAVSNYTIDEPVALSANVIKNEPLCFGVNDGSIQLDVAGGSQPYTFNWNNGATAQNLSSLASGNYAVTITDVKGCKTQVSTVLAQPAVILIQENHSTIGCGSNTKGSITANATGGFGSYLYQWSTGDFSSTVNNLPAGYYAVTVTDANGCTAELNNIELAPNADIMALAQVTDVACAGVNNGKVNLNINGGTAPYLFHWNNGSTAPNLTNVAAGVYSVSILDSKGCSANVNATVNNVNGLQMNALVTQPTCTNPQGAIDVNMLNGNAPYTFIWSNGSASEDIQNLTAGIYTLTILDANSCPLDTLFEIKSTSSLSITATGGGEINLGEAATLSVSSNSANVSYNWMPSLSIACGVCSEVTVSPTQTTDYTVVATDSNGCTAQQQVTVHVSSENNIFLPNAFTPNGDGNNDILQLYGNLSGIKYFQLMIFDRWGEKVYETNNQYFNWDGTYRGQRPDGAVFIYVMKVVYLNGKSERTFKGSINIL